MVTKTIFLTLLHVLYVSDWVLGSDLGPQTNEKRGYDVGVPNLCGCAEDYISSTEWSESGSGILTNTMLRQILWLLKCLIRVWPGLGHSIE